MRYMISTRYSYYLRVLLATTEKGDVVLDPFFGTGTTGAVAVYKPPNMMQGAVNTSANAVLPSGGIAGGGTGTNAIAPRKAPAMPKPAWHSPWKLYRVISGHMGWVRCVTVEPGNEWFATGAADRVIKIWDLASGKLKLSLTGHVSVVRGLAVSPRQPYLFSCGEDRQVI